MILHITNVDAQDLGPSSFVAKSYLLDLFLVLAILSNAFLSSFFVNGEWLPLTLTLIRLYCLSMWTCVSLVAILFSLENFRSLEVKSANLRRWQRLLYLWMGAAVGCLFMIAISLWFHPWFVRMQPSEWQARVIVIAYAVISFVCVVGMIWDTPRKRTLTVGNWDWNSTSKANDHYALRSPSVSYSTKGLEEKTIQTLNWEIFNSKDLTGLIVYDSAYPSHGGGYADIYCGTLSKSSLATKVAIKVIRAHTFKEADQWKIAERLKKEICLWLRLRHPNIVSLLGTTKSFDSKMAIVSPWMDNGDLNRYLSNKKSELNLRRRLEILTDVAEGLSYLHTQSVIHGDLRTHNIMIRDGKALLTDFGLANVMAEFRTISFVSSTMANALRWTAPEVCDFGKDSKIVPEVSRHCDIYSFGSVTLQVISGKIPYADIEQDLLVLTELMNFRYPIRPPEPLLSNEFWNFIVLCWAQRPEIDKVKKKLLDLRYSCSEFVLATNVVDADEQ